MTLLILIAWVVLTRWGSSAVIWPRTAATPPPPGRRIEQLPLDRTSVGLEALVSFVVVAAIPFTFVSEAFSAVERIGLVVLSPVIIRFGLDRLAKLRAGHLARWDGSMLSVPGFPKRTVERGDVASVRIRRVAFGPNDVVIAAGRIPVVLDTQFAAVDEPTLAGSIVDWLEHPST